MPAPLQERDRRTRNVTLIRVLRLMRLLRTPKTLQEIASELNVTDRTVRRDFDLLRAVRVPVWRSDKTGCWQIDRDGSEPA